MPLSDDISPGWTTTIASPPATPTTSTAFSLGHVNGAPAVPFTLRVIKRGQQANTGTYEDIRVTAMSGASVTTCTRNWNPETGTGTGTGMAIEAGDQCFQSLYDGVIQLRTGRYSPGPPTGVAATDTANWLALIALAESETDGAELIPWPGTPSVPAYLINAVLTTTKPHVWKGSGAGQGPGFAAFLGGSVMRTAASYGSGNLIYDNCIEGSKFYNIRFDHASGTRSAGAYIFVDAPGNDGTGHGGVYSCAFQSGYDNISLSYAFEYETMGNAILQFASTGVKSATKNSAEAGLGRVMFNTIWGVSGTSTTTTAGIYGAPASYSHIAYNSVLGCITGIFATAIAGSTGAFTVDHNRVEQFKSLGIWVTRTTAGQVLNLIDISDNELSCQDVGGDPLAASNIAYIAISQSNPTGTVYVTGMTIRNNTLNCHLSAVASVGISVLTGQHVQITGNMLNNNSASANAAPFSFSADCTAPFEVLDNQCYGWTIATRYLGMTAQITLRDNIAMAFANIPALAALGSQIVVSDGDVASNPLTSTPGVGTVAIRIGGPAWKGL